MPLRSAEQHYARQQRIDAAGLVAARRARWGSLGQLVSVMVAFQVLASRDAAGSVPLMLDEQNIDAEPVAAVSVAALAGTASDGRDLRGLMDHTRSRDVTSDAFDLIVLTQLQDVARAAAALAMAVRPRVTRYVRMLNPPSCSRCAVLAGRVYRFDAGFQRHPRCDCRGIPASEDTAGDLRTDPSAYFDSLPTARQLSADYPDLTVRKRQELRLYSQEDIFTKAGAEVIRRGADISQVVNARAGMSTAQVAVRGAGDRWTASGRLVRQTVFGRQVATTKEGMTKHGVAFKARGRGYVRLMPESLLEIADDRADALRLLKAHGYVS